jgi:hypothetical protein
MVDDDDDDDIEREFFLINSGRGRIRQEWFK